MSNLPKSTVSYNYDTNIVYKNYSENLPHLSTWIDEILALNERSCPVKTNPTTEHLAQALQRYDSIFKELFRQSSIHSEQLTRLLAKSWMGVVKLFDYMIKSYHRYSKHTSHVQEQSQELIRERQGQIASSSVLKEEYELQRTALRAKIRTLEARIEVVSATNREVSNENTRLRKIIDIYIKSQELNEQSWDIMDDNFIGKAKQEDDIDDDSTTNDGSITAATGSHQNSLDASKIQFQILSRLEIEMGEVLAQVIKEEDRQRFLLTDIMHLMKKNQDIFGSGTAVNGKWKTGKVEEVEMVDEAVQVDEKQKFGVVDDLILSPRDTDALGPSPIIPSTSIVVRGEHIPYQLRRRMKSFPFVLRVPTSIWLCQQIMAIYVGKIRFDEENKNSLRKVTLADYVHQYYLKSYNMECLVDMQISQLISACEAYIKTIPRVSLFAAQIGLLDKEAEPPLDVRDTEFILSALSYLISQGELLPDKSTIKVKGKLKKEALNIRPDITRAVAVDCISHLFGQYLPDGGADYVIKVKSMSSTEKGTKYIDIDMFLDVLIDPWQQLRMNWEEHAHFLFDMHCNVYRVLSDVQFANDFGNKDRDSVLMQINKQSANDCLRRPIRSLMVKKDSGNNDDDDDNAKPAADVVVKKPPSGQANANKEPVCELMNRKAFTLALTSINPNLNFREIDSFYDESLFFAHNGVVRILQQLWLRVLVDNNMKSASKPPTRSKQSRDHKEKPQANPAAQETDNNAEKYCYVNVRTMASQWTKPYHDRVFKAADIEEATFVKTVVYYNLFASSPLLELMHIAPKDLWPNADMFIKQLNARKKKAEDNAAAQLLHQQMLKLEEEARHKREEEERQRIEWEQEVERKRLEEEAKKSKKSKKKPQQLTTSSPTKDQSLKEPSISSMKSSSETNGTK